VRAGKGREKAHEAIKEHAVAVALAMRETGLEQNDLVERLARDARLGLDGAVLREAFANPLDFAGAASEQTRAFVSAVEAVVAKHPDAARYQSEPIL
jgi:adenylosuccinate lyase